jgi:uncharacterized membrane protein
MWCRNSKILRVLAVIAIVWSSGHIFASGLEGFWHKDSQWHHRATLQRKIYVSARADQHEDEQRLRVEAMGIINAPKVFTAEKAKDYDELPKVSGHFKTVEYRPDKRQLFVVTEALRWQARMLLQLQYETDEKGNAVHSFEVIGGSFQGLTGEFTFVDFEGSQTQLILRARYSNKKLPLPKVLMGMALEVIMEQVAQKLRSHMEKSYQNRSGFGVASDQEKP